MKEREKLVWVYSIFYIAAWLIGKLIKIAEEKRNSEKKVK